MSDVLDDLLEAWSVHNEIHDFILDWIPDGGLEAVTLLKTGKPSRGRNVARIFAQRPSPVRPRPWRTRCAPRSPRIDG